MLRLSDNKPQIVDILIFKTKDSSESYIFREAGGGIWFFFLGGGHNIFFSYS